MKAFIIATIVTIGCSPAYEDDITIYDVIEDCGSGGTLEAEPGYTRDALWTAWVDADGQCGDSARRFWWCAWDNLCDASQCPEYEWLMYHHCNDGVTF